jgi:DNA-binding XRE family transcriptional regulator
MDHPTRPRAPGPASAAGAGPAPPGPGRPRPVTPQSPTRPTGLAVTVAAAGWRGVLTDPAGRTVWTCRHPHPTVAGARQCAQREREVPGLGDLGFRLRQLRQAAGLSQRQAAAALDCSDSKVSRIETGESLASPRDVRDLAALYQASPPERDALVAAARAARAARASWATRGRQPRQAGAR